MMVMTAKVDIKRIALILGAIAAGIIGIILLFGEKADTQTTSAPTATGNDARVSFLENFGWEVESSPEESSLVRIPENVTEVFDRYNQLQKNQGYDLTKLAGKNAMRYVYRVTNYPGASDPVYATVLIHNSKIVGGDITDTSPGGKVQGFKKAPAPDGATLPSETQPSA